MLDSTFVPPAQEPHDPEARIAALEADLAAARNVIALLQREIVRRDEVIDDALAYYQAGVLGPMAEKLREVR